MVKNRDKGEEVRLAGMTLEQEIEYWRRRSEQFQQDLEKLRAQAGVATAPASLRK